MIRLKKIKINNFKSLVNFEIEFEKFNCIIGLNGSGKSTFLQSLDFISQQIRGEVKQWLRKRNWEVNNLHSKLLKTKNISVSLELKDDISNYIYDFEFNTSLLRCTSENIIVNGKKILRLENTKYSIDGKAYDVMQEYEGSILSSLKEDKIPESIIRIKNFVKNITSLDLLSPQSMRQKSRNDGVELGLSGEYLTSFLNQLDKYNKEKILTKLRICYPNILDFDVSSSRAGWKKLELIEKFEDTTIKTEAKHINDGLLRILAILAQIYDKKNFLLFDEIENGINPELIEFLVDSLQEVPHQVLITTHSPLVLNYIEDEEAKKSIKYIYKTKEGQTKVIRFFEIPSVLKKLSIMGAGEVYVDTNLSKLYDEIIYLENKK